MYDRTVAAALAETQSKFALAEALALDIPPRTRGRHAEDDDTPHVADLLLDARTAIIEAGGEPRSVKTLSDYRLTAIWVCEWTSKSSEFGTFRWAPEASFSAHNEARGHQMTYTRFARLKDKTVDNIRRLNNRAGTDGPAVKVAEKWTPEERAEVVQHAIKHDPQVAQVAKDALLDREIDETLEGSGITRQPYQQVPDPVEPVDRLIGRIGEDALTAMGLIADMRRNGRNAAAEDSRRRLREVLMDMLTRVEEGVLTT